MARLGDGKRMKIENSTGRVNLPVALRGGWTQMGRRKVVQLSLLLEGI